MNVWSYKGKRVVVFGCYSGIGAEAARELVRLGAEVHGFDIKPSPVEMASFGLCDLRDRRQIDAAIDSIAGGIDALFYCAGLPQTFPAIEVVQVNFLSVRYLVERALPKMKKGSAIAVIASTAGNGYVQRLPLLTEFVTTSDYDAGLVWAEPRLADLGDPYAFAKEAVIVWGLRQSTVLIKQDVRINLLSPGPTESGMMKDFEAVASARIIDVYTHPICRRSSSAEQAYPLIFLNSDAATYINGCNFITDGGFVAGMAMGQIDLAGLLAEATAG
jgi:NAD(P)-dependent dehydrogenase (short-subunit alcohol dehydrogenase family)